MSGFSRFSSSDYLFQKSLRYSCTDKYVMLLTPHLLHVINQKYKQTNK